MKKIFYISLFLLFFCSCKETINEDVTPQKSDTIIVTNDQFKTMNMKIGVLEEQNFDVDIQTTGKIDVPPQNRAKITTFVGGYVKSTTLLVGNKVTKGQALITLESTDFIDIQKEYLESVEQMSYLKSEYDRQLTLYNEKITSQKNYLKAESDYKKNKAIYQSLRSKLALLKINIKQVEKGVFTSKITLYSPISGDIVVMNANVGMYVSPSDVILEIVETSHLHLELNVFEKDILNVKEGQKIKFSATEASKEVFEASVHLVGKSIEGNDRTINVHGHLAENIKQRLLTGMFVEAAIITNSKKGFAVNKEAISTKGQKNFVLLLVSNSNDNFFFKKVAVQKGASNENFVEIIPNKEINSNSKLLLSGVFDLIN
jgi:cobalt-zinc-cadmium efflux system membrane fusion protein